MRNVKIYISMLATIIVSVAFGQTQQGDTLTRPVAAVDITLYNHIKPVAFKTNLLFDAVGAWNVELEFPLSPRTSLAAQFISPWWLWSRRQHALQMRYATIEARYWFKPDKTYYRYIETRNPMTGWFAGVYYGGGIYDFERSTKGWQGESKFGVGLSGGYVKPLSCNFNLEFSLSAGWLATDYRYYNAQMGADGRWHLIKQYDGKYSYLGLTGAKISLVWVPKFRKEAKR